MADQCMLSTSDNPFNPFTQYDEWWAFDTRNGYHSAAYVARITRTSEELSIADQELAIEQAIDEIVSENLFGIYIKVKKSQSMQT